MNYSQNDIDLVERYFDNTLTEQETAQLKYRLDSDSELKRLFEQEKLLINTIRYQGAQNNLQFLKQLEQTLEQPQGRLNMKPWYYYAAAACIALLIAAGIFWPSSQDTSKDLYAAYFEPYPNVFEPTLRSSNAASHLRGSITATSERSEAFKAYEDENYEKASRLFATLIKENKEPGMLLLLGNSNLALGRTTEAKENFSELITTFDDLDIQAKWFLSLCYLKEGNVTQARELLKELGDTEISYATKARELLNKVD
jgi:hypothetical protein